MEFNIKTPVFRDMTPCNLVDRYQYFCETFTYTVKVQTKWRKWDWLGKDRLGPAAGLKVGLGVWMQAGLWVNQWQPMGTKRISSILKREAAGCSKIMAWSLQSSCIKSWKTVTSKCHVLRMQTQFLAACYIQEQKTITLWHNKTVLTWL